MGPRNGVVSVYVVVRRGVVTVNATVQGGRDEGSKYRDTDDRIGRDFRGSRYQWLILTVKGMGVLDRIGGVRLRCARGEDGKALGRKTSYTC